MYNTPRKLRPKARPNVGMPYSRATTPAKVGTQQRTPTPPRPPPPPPPPLSAREEQAQEVRRQRRAHRQNRLAGRIIQNWAQNRDDTIRQRPSAQLPFQFAPEQPEQMKNAAKNPPTP